MALPREGSAVQVMVVAPTSFSDAGYFGELIACSLVAHGVVGLILDAGARDVAEIETASVDRGTASGVEPAGKTSC